MIIRDENYFTDKYELTRTHSEVLEAVKVVKPGKTLDLGNEPWDGFSLKEHQHHSRKNKIVLPIKREVIQINDTGV